jgi:hypothetical protein
MVTSSETWPIATSVAIVHHVTPTSHIPLATTQIWKCAPHTEIERILPEQAIAINCVTGRFTLARCHCTSSASCTYSQKSVSSVWSQVFENHALFSTMLKHLQPHKTPSPKTALGSIFAPTMQSIIVDRKPIVHPQFASIIGDDCQAVIACFEYSHAPCPTRSIVVRSSKTRPSTISSFHPIADRLSPSSHVWAATVQIRAPSSLSEIESIFPEDSMPVYGSMASRTSCIHNIPTISSIGTSVPEEHARMTTVFKHLESHKVPSTALMPVRLPIAPAM